MAMEPVNSLVSTLGLVAVLGALGRIWWNRLPEVPPDRRASTRDKLLNDILYFLFGAILISTPAASFFIAINLRIHPRAVGILMLAAGGAFLSLFVPLVLARLAGRERLEGFWLYMEASSRVRRRTMIVLWLGVTVFVFAAGLAALSANK